MPPRATPLPRPVPLSETDGPPQDDLTLSNQAPGAPVPVTALERETGISKEVARKWELRYGFPRPERNESGERVYSADQVVSLRLIHRLLGAGLRPGKVVGLDLPALNRLIERLGPDGGPSPWAFSQQVMDALRHHDLDHLEHLLRGQLNRQGLSTFVRETVARLNVIIGDAWLRGDIRVFEEHLYTEIVRGVLHDSVRVVSERAGSPRILLSTAPGEHHTLGLLMANAALALEGACCIGLGAQTPVAEIVTAVDACSIDIVGLSFSIAFPARDSAQFLRDLRGRLPGHVDIWAGGLGVSRLHRIAGVCFMRSLEDVAPAVQGWVRRETTGQCP